ncbi:MAG: UvrB/UvrC motif-containing protein [Dethiobacteria bacterium]|jgi:protein arginine kinase activator
MLCQNCEKRKATVHFTKIINGKKTEIYLCESCAAEKGDLDFPFEGQFPLQQFFSSIIGMMPSGGKFVHTPPAGSMQCPDCGLTYDQFGQIGRFGCAECYKSYGENLIPLLRRLHGNQRHIGKLPVRAGKYLKQKKEIESLREELQKRIEEEAFEEAARIRDEIRKLEKHVSSGDDKQ